jgi:hypothetical protein
LPTPPTSPAALEPARANASRTTPSHRISPQKPSKSSGATDSREAVKLPNDYAARLADKISAENLDSQKSKNAEYA